uniref:Uncharacterized protein n=1 Tax=Vitis vinifera TaxID=29760 RepID=A5AL00_VITVI|nr:hypothetical protein VITISV_007902 [Vitis vinifera]
MNQLRHQLGTNQMAPLPGMVPLYSDMTFSDCACHIEYEIAEEVMNFMSYVAKVSRGWDEPNARDMGRMTSQPNTKVEMYILNDGIDMKAKIATMARRLEELEMKKMQEVCQPQKVQEKGKFPSQPHQNSKGIHQVEAQKGESSMVKEVEAVITLRSGFWMIKIKKIVKKGERRKLGIERSSKSKSESLRKSPPRCEMVSQPPSYEMVRKHFAKPRKVVKMPTKPRTMHLKRRAPLTEITHEASHSISDLLKTIRAHSSN